MVFHWINPSTNLLNQCEYFPTFCERIITKKVSNNRIRDAKSKFSKSGVFRKKSGVYQEIFFLKSGGKSGAFYTKSQGLLDGIPLD